MLSQVRNILFDLDGTLTDPKEGITCSIQYALEKMGQETPPHQDQLEWCIGPPLVDVFRELLNTEDEQSIQDAVAHYRDRYEAICASENILYPDIESTLSHLKDKGYRLFLATSKPWLYATKILEYFNLDKYFEKIYGSELDGTRDYKTDLIRYILSQSDLASEQTVMVGDRRFDVIGARENNVLCMAVTYGYGTIAELEEAAPDYMCDHHRDVPAHLGHAIVD